MRRRTTRYCCDADDCDYESEDPKDLFTIKGKLDGKPIIIEACSPAHLGEVVVRIAANN